MHGHVVISVTHTYKQPAKTTSSLLDDVPWVQSISKGFHAETTSIVYRLGFFVMLWLPFASTIDAGCFFAHRIEPVISSGADVLWVLESNVLVEFGSGGVGMTPWEGEEVKKCEERHFDAE